MPYKCSCGFTEEKMGLFVAHFRYNKGNGDHKSQGFLDPVTGELRPTKEVKQAKGNASASSPASSGSTSSGMKTATGLADAQIVAISPRRFETTSNLLWQARQAAINELDWPADISPEDFLDTWLFLSFKNLKRRSIILGAYQVVTKENGNGSEGHSR